MRSILGEDEGGFDLDPGFNFDEDGNIIVTGEGTPMPGSAAQPSGLRLGSDSAASARVRQELEEGNRAGQIDVSTPTFSPCIELTCCSWETEWTWTLILTFQGSTKTI
jgi:hypothetical protein